MTGANELGRPQRSENSPHARGLATIIDEVRALGREGERKPEFWRPTGDAVGGLRLLMSTDLTLVAVVDLERLLTGEEGTKLSGDVGGLTSAVDQIARDLRFTINDADTAQALVLLLAVHGDRFREVAGQFFGSESPRGDYLIRVLPTTPLPAQSREEEGDTVVPSESPGEWLESVRCDLEPARNELVVGVPSISDARDPAFAKRSRSHARQVLETALGSSSEATDHANWLSEVLDALVGPLADGSADAAPERAAAEVVGRLEMIAAQAKPPAPQTRSEG